VTGGRRPVAVGAALLAAACGTRDPAAVPAPDADLPDAPAARADRAPAAADLPPAPPDLPATPAADASARPGWRLVWSDEFEGPAGAAPDPGKWQHDVGGGGWGNRELEFHTARRENSALDGQGHLAITARREAYMGREYTSARMNTAGKFEQAYGRFEARIQLPAGAGIWPAFWMLGANIAQAPWPACGEIDIMELSGREPAVSHGSLHGPGYSGGNPLTRSYRLPDGATFPADFHLFAVEWEEGAIRFYVDEQLFQTRTPADLAGQAGKTWVFDHPFFLILNVAVGGTFPGPPDDSTPFPQTMLVDYVRVYAR
jgi:beta-glucanase (GH16 family)